MPACLLIAVALVQIHLAHVRQILTPALAKLTAWWTAAIETALAAVFLLPSRLAVSRYRHALLLLFAWTTYLLATVATFGWLLLTIGVGQCEPELPCVRSLVGR